MQQIPRGVYTAPFLSPNLEVVIVSIDSHGRRLREVVVPGGTPPAAIIAQLKTELDQVDLTPA